MNLEAVLEVPTRILRVESPPKDSELYPSSIRALLLAWQASRLDDYLDDPTRVRVIGDETGARI